MTPTKLPFSLLLLAAAGCSGVEGANGTAEPVSRTDEALAPGAVLGLTAVASANPKAPGISSPNVLSPELIEAPVAQGSSVLENPQVVAIGGGASVTIGNYGYMGDGPFVPVGNDVQSATHNVEAQKTEPDKNTYLVLHHQHGADPDYDYGTHPESERGAGERQVGVNGAVSMTTSLAVINLETGHRPTAA